jgi:hypothetical protein
MANRQEDPPAERNKVQLCRRCNQEIIWAITQRGSHIPLNAVHSLVFVMEGEKIDGAPVVSQRRAYVTHFATCPHADEFRKKKPPKERKVPDEAP